MMFFRSWRYVIFLVLFQATVPMLSYAQSIDFGRYHALLIANKNYTYWKPLDTPYNDVYDLAEILKNKYGFSIDTDDILLDATRDQIIEKLEELRGTLGGQDNLLIYYAGHGKSREDGGYWIGIDAERRSSSRWLHFRTLLNLIDRKNGIKARHVVIIADSCHAGAIFRGDDDSAQKNNDETIPAWLLRMNRNVSRTALTSGGIEEVIDIVGNSRNSIFAWELINRLKNNDKVLDMRTLYNQINKEVHARARNVVGEKAQAPEYAALYGFGHSSGDFIFVPKGTIIKFPPIYKKENDYATRKDSSVKDSSVPASTAPLRISPSCSSKHIKKGNSFNFYVNRFSNGTWQSLHRSEFDIETTGDFDIIDDGGDPDFSLKGKGNIDLLITDKIKGGSVKCSVFFED